MADRRTKALNIKPVSYDIYCSACGKSKTSRSFYSSKQAIHDNDTYHKRYPICKDCIKNEIYRKDTGQIDKSKFKQILQKLNLPFVNDSYLLALADSNETFGTYVKNLNFQFKGKTDICWEDGETSEEDEKERIMNDNKSLISQELIDKWGTGGYTSEEYLAFEHKYQQLKNNYKQTTTMHTEALLKYIRYSCKEEMATANNDVDDAKKWADMANKAATNAKINPSQLSKADLSEGLSTFSELSQAVEKEIDIIPILPKFKYRPNDALDFNIWCYVNYMRDLAGLPPCKYEEVYAFYDKRKADYVKQYGDPYGIFTDDTSEKNRDNIKQFIKDDKESDSDA